MRDLFHAPEGGEKSQRTVLTHLEMAHQVVPGVEEVPKGTGGEKISSD